jgi:competence protein ComEA
MRQHAKELLMTRIKHFASALLVCATGAAFAGPVNVNTADAETISAELQGVGISKAIAIVEYRQANGPFKSADELVQVKGIGERTVDINRKHILVQSAGKKND